MEYVLGIDIGGTNIRTVAVCRDGTLLGKAHASSAFLKAADDPVLALGHHAQQFVATLPGQLCGVCAGFPGTVSRNKDVVYSCPNLAAFTNRDIASPLCALLGVPVIAEHDVILLMMHDIAGMDLAGKSCIIGLYLGTGVGNAIWANGDFLYGANGVSGELGHVPVLGRSDPCPCGNTGCIELYTGGKQLRQLAERHFPGTPFKELFRHHAGAPVLREYLHCVAAAVATEVNILDPDCVFLGGGVLNMAAFPLEALQREILRATRKPLPHDTLRFLRSSTDTFAGAVGAGLYYWRRQNGAAQ